MQIFLMWRTDGERRPELDPASVEARLQRVFAPLFAAPPAARVLATPTAALVSLEIPIKGWIAPHFEAEAGAWAFAPEYPASARDALERRGAAAPDGRVLLALAEQFERDAEPLLRDLAPMFSLLWNRGGEMTLQNDGLGQAQLFEYDDGRIHAVSNKIAAFRALGIEPRPVAAEWAVRMTLDWFPGLMSGYRNIKLIAPATQLRFTPGGVERKNFDVVGHWIRRESLSREGCLELAHEGFQRHIRSAARLWTEARCGLTGGFDSRAVASGLISQGLADKVHFAVRGRQESIDVELASKLARIAHIKLSVRTRAMRPPGDAELLRRGIDLALLWQSGYIDLRQHASFMNGSGDLAGGEVNVMGQHGEIGRSYFVSRIHANLIRPDRFEAALLNFCMFENTRGHYLVRREHLPFIRDAVTRAYREADRHGLEGLDRLDFFYLFERTRRWASAGNHIQPGHIVTPFLIPEYVHAVYNYPALERAGEPFHRFIIQRNCPDWSDISYQKELELRRLAKADRALRRSGRLNWYGARLRARAEALALKYWPALIPPRQDVYWNRVGLPLIREINAGDGFWSEVFDAGRARKLWHLAPEQLAVTAFLPTPHDGIADETN